MEIWIDIAGLEKAQSLFNISPLERHLRALKRLKPAPSRIVLSGPEGSASSVPRRTGAPELIVDETPLAARLARYLKDEAKEDVLVIDATSLVDPRLPVHLNKTGPSLAARTGEGPEQGALMRLAHGDDLEIPAAPQSVLELANTLLDTGAVNELKQEDFPGFISNLRRTNPFYVSHIPSSEAARQREQKMFKDNYKGSTDFLTKWVYPPLVWPLVQLCTRFNIHPNTVTIIGIFCTITAVPLFMDARFGVGLIFAYVMSVLDSVDGKVARLTLTDSPIGNVLDHGLDIVHPPFWYLAWAWGMTGGDTSAPIFIAALLMTGFYIGDRLVLMVAKAHYGRGLHAVTALDGVIRTVIARRNTILVILTVGYLLGFMEIAFYIVVAWQGLTMAWHGWRTIYLWRLAESPNIS